MASPINPSASPYPSFSPPPPLEPSIKKDIIHLTPMTSITHPSLAESGKSISKLSVSDGDKSQYGELKKTLKEWGILTDSKSQLVPPDDPCYEILQDSLTLCNVSYNILKRTGPEFLDTRGYIVCRDSDNRIQAIGIYDKANLSLLRFITHPNNINHPINDGIPNKVRGAGTAVIVHLATKALFSESDIKLRAFEAAIPFYQKLHFEQAGPTYYDMQLTATKIQTLVTAKIPPFDQISEG